MNTFWSALSNTVNYISMIGIADVFDILIVALLIFECIRIFRKTRTLRVARGILVLLVMLWLSGILGLTMINYLLRKTVELGLIAILILFQPELRRFLEKVGNSNRISRMLGFTENIQDRNIENVIKETAEACEDMGAVKTGALIVFARDNRLADRISTGTLVDASVSSQLYKNLFFKNSPLHDGAVIVLDGRIRAAGCLLPVSQNDKISKELGTRHRAGIGISEQSDAVVVIVSEETGSISLAIDGHLERHLDRETLYKRLREELLMEDNETERQKWTPMNIIRGFRNGK